MVSILKNKAIDKRLIAMNLDLERLLVGHGDDIYEDAKTTISRIFAGPRP
jgi:hypothetical protein